jgi:hypothetical protein
MIQDDSFRMILACFHSAAERAPSADAFAGKLTSGGSMQAGQRAERQAAALTKAPQQKRTARGRRAAVGLRLLALVILCLYSWSGVENTVGRRK